MKRKKYMPPSEDKKKSPPHRLETVSRVACAALL